MESIKIELISTQDPHDSYHHNFFHNPEAHMMSSQDRLRTVLVTGANGYIGNAVARAFVRGGWHAYGLLRSTSGARPLALEEILPVIGTIDDLSSHKKITEQLPPTIDAIVSVTEDHSDYVKHYNNIVALLRSVSASSSAHGVRPLVIFTSGCKDYGTGPHFANDPSLSPHTEESPLNPPQLLKLRAEYAQKIFEHGDAFVPVLVRPTNVHGRSSSYYGGFFDVAKKAAEAATPLVMPSRPDSICHSMHVDDCADAYVAIASHSRQDEVGGQIFNISARRYETVAQLGEALVAEYGLSKGVEFAEFKEAARVHDWTPMLVDFPQWTGSEKLRRMTGWSDHRPLFSEAMHVYRVAFEATEPGTHKVQDMKALFDATALSGRK